MEIEIGENVVKVCKFCNELVHKNYKSYCSFECYNKHEAIKKKLPSKTTNKICKQCQQITIIDGGVGDYCSFECAERAKPENIKEKLFENFSSVSSFLSSTQENVN